CSSTPAFSAFGALVSLKRVAWARPFATAFAVNGNTIAVTDSINTEPPPPPGGPRPQCVNTSAALGTLVPGDYTVNWYVVDIGGRPKGEGPDRSAPSLLLFEADGARPVVEAEVIQVGVDVPALDIQAVGILTVGAVVHLEITTRVENGVLRDARRLHARDRVV